MSEAEFDPDATLEAAAALIGLDLAKASREVVKAHLETAERLSRLVMAFELDCEAEPAPVFAA